MSSPRQSLPRPNSFTCNRWPSKRTTGSARCCAPSPQATATRSCSKAGRAWRSCASSSGSPRTSTCWCSANSPTCAPQSARCSPCWRPRRRRRAATTPTASPAGGWEPRPRPPGSTGPGVVDQHDHDVRRILMQMLGDRARLVRRFLQRAAGDTARGHRWEWQHPAAGQHRRNNLTIQPLRQHSPFLRYIVAAAHHPRGPPRTRNGPVPRPGQQLCTTQQRFVLTV